MLIFIVRYVFMYWILLGSTAGELINESVMAEKDFYRLSECTARCMQQQSANFNTCYDYCKSGNAPLLPYKNLTQIQENYSLKLVCRDDRSLTFRINLEQMSAIQSEITTQNSIWLRRNSTAFIDTSLEATTVATEPTKALAITAQSQTLYLIKVQNSTQMVLYLSDDNFFTIPNLQNNTVHKITVVAFHSNSSYSVIAKEETYATLRRGYKPNMITDIQVKGFSADENNDRHLVATIIWKPSADMTCYYDIICYALVESGFDLTPLEIRNPRELYTYKLENLTFSAIYKVGIRAKNPNNNSMESDLLWNTFQAPTCVEWYNYNFNICPPLEPEGLEAEAMHIRKNVYALNISWNMPKYFPDNYTLRIVDTAEGGETYLFNVSKEETSFFIPEVTIKDVIYRVHLNAYTPGGNASVFVSEYCTKLVVVADKSQHLVKWIAAILAPIFCVAILSLTIFIICHRRAKLKRYQERCKYFEELEKKAPIDPKATFDFPTKSLPLLTAPEELTQFQLDLEEKIFFNDSMEIDHNNVTLYEVLGEGAFGLVRRGTYNDDKLGPREVAVKMLKDHPSVDDVRAFRREIEVMKSVEKHPNIVGIIGHCTKSYSNMMLLTEYCSFGNLLDFLRDEWKYLYELNVKRGMGCSLPRRLHAQRQQLEHSSQNRRNAQSLHERKHMHCNSNNNNNNNSGAVEIFNIDATIIKRLKLKYRNLSALQPRTPTTNTSANIVLTTNASDNITTTTKTNAAADNAAVQSSARMNANKSNGYNQICSNTCKCQLSVVIKNIDPNDTNAHNSDIEQQRKQPTLSPEVCKCQCQETRLSKKNRKNAAMTANEPQQQQQQQQQQQFTQLTVENKSYFNCLPEVGSFEVALRQRQWQRRNARFARALAKDNNDVGDSSMQKALSGTMRRVPLSAADLLDIARQVAVGMEFLAKNKVVHRDLAARNVLVAPDRTIKIADFGLSRDIYQENVYKKTGNGKLPIKWLAVESMTHQVYTTQSDVWSYGILLYEIVTLGGTPYPSIPTNRLLHLLKTGYRMEKPKNCGQEFYDLMYACWNVNPAERPTFTEIKKILENLLVDAPQKQIESVLGVTTNLQREEQLRQAELQQSAEHDEDLNVGNEEDSYLKPL